MIYLYAALGVVMMTGIMAVVEMGLSLTGQSILLKPDDLYQQNFVTEAVGKREQQMLNLLHNQNDLSILHIAKNAYSYSSRYTSYFSHPNM